MGPDIDESNLPHFDQNQDPGVYISFHSMLYHHWFQESFAPDLVIAFSCGVHDESWRESWKPTIELCWRRKFFTVFTVSDETEAEACRTVLDQWKPTNQNQDIHIQKNPFQSLWVSFLPPDSFFACNSVLLILTDKKTN